MAKVHGLFDKNGKEIRKGARVRVTVQGCETEGVAVRVRPLKAEIVFTPGAYFIPANRVEVID